ncbi:MAG: hypothetical protein QM737_01800 [Ferruginibacter sp.]
MKKKFFLILNLIAMAFIVSAQAPNAIPYQGVARNPAGNILASQAISLRVSIHDATANGTVVFSETHSATTSTLGLFNVNIGQGSPLTGTLAGVNWGSGAKFMQVEFDPAGGTSYTDMGTSQLNSVPYALYAGNSGGSGQWTTAANDIYNNNTGNVGIGNSAPLYKLDVSGESGFSTRMRGNMILDGSEGLFGTGWIGFRNTTSGLEWDMEGGPDYFTVGRSGVGYDFTIASNGNVGIGTGIGSAPAAKLEVAGNIKIADGTEGAGKVLTSDANGVASWQIVSGGGSETDPEVSSATANQVAKWNGTTLVDGSITDDGTNVGIGNNTPLYKLDVSGQSGVSTRMRGNMILDGSEGLFGTGWIGFRNTTSGLEWDMEGGPDYFTVGRSGVGYDLTVASNGNVGIGTGIGSAPAAKLEVAGNIKITDGTEGAGKVLTSDANGVASWQTPVGGGTETDPEVSNTITNQVAKWNGTALVDGSITDDGTNVGIGNNTPLYKLDVSGQSGFSTRMRGNMILDGSEGLFGTGWIGFRNTTSGLEWDMEGGPDYFTVGRSGVGYDLTVASNGNVGIGTGIGSAPAAKLEVAGNIKITDGTQGAGKVLVSDANGVASWSATASLLKTVNTDLNPSGFAITNAQNNQLIYDNHSSTIATDLAAGFTCDGIYFSGTGGTITCTSAILYEKNSNTAVSSISMPAGAHVRIQAVSSTQVFVTVY